jgi:AMMECR1 domain-containing protein
MVGNDREEMLRIACRKAGLRTDAWRRPDAHVYAFRTDRFGGPAVS